MIELQATDVIYRNPKPYLRARHALHPTLAWLGGDEVLAAFDVGEGPESLDYATYTARSTDGGRTWSAPRPLLPPIETGRYANQIVRIGRMRDGLLVGLGARIYRDDPEEGFISRETFGYAPMELFLIRSADRGHTWTEPAVIRPPLTGPAFELCHPVVELRDGRWLAPVSTWKGWEGTAPNGMKAIALVSHDRGRSWPEYLDVMDGWDRGLVHFEQSLAELTDGRLLAVTWALHEASGRSEPVPYALSTGGAFGPRRSTGLKGQTTKLIALDDGHVLALCRREDRPGLWASLARIEGERWVQLDEAPIWQGSSGRTMGEAARGDELANLKLGSPNTVRLDAQTLLAAFWCHEDEVSVIRWARIGVPATRSMALCPSAGATTPGAT